MDCIHARHLEVVQQFVVQSLGIYKFLEREGVGEGLLILIVPLRVSLPLLFENLVSALDDGSTQLGCFLCPVPV